MIPGAQVAGLGLLLTAGIVGVVVKGAAKIHEAWSQRQAQKQLVAKQSQPGYVENKSNNKITHQLTDSIELSSTASLYHKMIQDHQNKDDGLSTEEITARMQQHLQKIVGAGSKEGIINFFKHGDEVINKKDSIVTKDIWLTAFRGVDQHVKDRAINLYEDAIKSVEDSSLHLSSRTIDVLAKSNLLDEGCGLGSAKERLTELYQKVDVHGLK